MKIINSTGDPIAYLVTPSGTVISGSPIVASGTIGANSALEFQVSGAGLQPLVYVKSIAQYNQGYFGIKVANGQSSVRISLTES